MQSVIYYHCFQNRPEPVYSYIVWIGGMVFEMSHHADQPNGVCMYMGTDQDIKLPLAIDDVVIPWHSASDGIKRAISNIIADINAVDERE